MTSFDSVLKQARLPVMDSEVSIEDAKAHDKAVRNWNLQPYDPATVVDVTGLTETNCHWPVRDCDRRTGKLALFCGKPAERENCSYCDFHHAKSINRRGRGR